MKPVRNARKLALGAVLLATAAIPAAVPASSFATPIGIPRVTTGSVKHVRGTTGQLDAVVNPNGAETSYYFEYGPTVAYGTVTKPVAVGKGEKGIPVGQQVTGLLPGYHYRVVAVYVGGKAPIDGKDKSFAGGKSSKLRFEIAKGKEGEITVSYGSTAELAGSLSGLGNTDHGLILQGTPYPYKATFEPVLGPVHSSLSGGFVFRVAKLLQNTEFRILTTDTRPLYSPLITVHVTPKIILHVRRAAGRGNYRLYGTIAPARLRGTLEIQELKPQKANSKRESPRTHTVGVTTIHKWTKTQSKFSVVLTLSGTSHYRVYIKLPKGSLDSGHSNEQLVHAPKSTTSKKHAHAHARGHAKKRK